MVHRRIVATCLLVASFSANAQAQTPFDTQISTYQPSRPGDRIDRPPITGNYAKGQYTQLSVYRASKGDAKGLVVILNDVDLYGLPRGFAQTRFVQQLVDNGIAVAYIWTRPAHRFGKGIAYIFANTPKFKTSGPVAIIGIGVGAAHAGLIGTDPTILEAAGIDFKRLRLVSLVNSSVLDGPRAVTSSPDRYRKRYLTAYGPDEATQRTASMEGHIGGVDAPMFHVLNEVRRENWAADGRPTLDRLRATGAAVIFDTMPEIKRDANIPNSSKFGDKGHAPSMRLLTLLKERLAASD
jgi:hypothetical protein